VVFNKNSKEILKYYFSARVLVYVVVTPQSFDEMIPRASLNLNA